MGLTVDTTAIQAQFNKLATFPFDNVVEIMTNHVRELLKRALHLSYLPYTEKQQIALYNTLNRYPLESDVITQLKEVRQLVSTIDNQVVNASTIERLSQADGNIFKLSEIVYQIPDRYYWMVAAELHTLYTKLHDLAPHDVTINTVREYLKAHHLRKTTAKLADLDIQVSDDVTALCYTYTYPHPEVYFALLKANEFMRTFYGEIRASMLFIYDVNFKVAEYLEKVRNTFDGIILDAVYQRLYPSETKHREYTTSELVTLLVRTIAEYQQHPAPSLKQMVLEYAEALMQKPYHELRHYKDLNQYLDTVDKIRQTEVV